MMAIKDTLRVSLLILLVAVCGCGNNDEMDDAFSNITPSKKKPVAEKALSETAVEVEDTSSGVMHRDPFITAEEEALFSRGEEITSLEDMELSAVFISEERSYAVVNGNVVEKDSMIEGKKVVRINKEDIILEDEQGKYIVRVK